MAILVAIEELTSHDIILDFPVDEPYEDMRARRLLDLANQTATIQRIRYRNGGWVVWETLDPQLVPAGHRFLIMYPRPLPDN